MTSNDELSSRAEPSDPALCIQSDESLPPVAPTRSTPTSCSTKDIVFECKKPSSSMATHHSIEILFLRAGSDRSLALRATPRCNRLCDGGACRGLTSGSPCGQEWPRVKVGTRRSLSSSSFFTVRAGALFSLRRLGPFSCSSGYAPTQAAPWWGRLPGFD